MKIQGAWFKDDDGRTLMLRGVNLGGSSKVPVCPDGSPQATYRRDGFFDHRRVSFVGHPFPLQDADEHFSRLREWGFTFVRFLVTWEAIEHAGPGNYDEAYLDYVAQVVQKANEHGINLFIDPHQDVWSRFSGGDGAPGWTFELVGLNMERFAETGAAIVHCTHGDPFPRMIWPTNNGKLAAATMFTLFFGGADFAPRLKVDGEPVQDYLQRHYMAAIKQVALRLKGLPNVVGYDTLNEPSSGFIGCADLAKPLEMLLKGQSPSAYQAMLLGSGFPQEVDTWDVDLRGVRRTGKAVVNAKGVRAWREGCDCIWKQHGVWDEDAKGTPRLLRPDYFAQVNGRKVNFPNDYFRPFVNRYAQEIRSVDPDAIIFVEGTPSGALPDWRPADAANIVQAGHWYDGFTLFMKNFHGWFTFDILNSGRLVVGPGNVRRCFANHLAHVKRETAQHVGNIPVLLGEFGIPFDMQGKHAYRTGDFSKQVQALDASFQAVEANLLNCTLWNYAADNTNARGDQWNDEDLSIFSRDQRTNPDDIHSGGRALAAVIRPYARKIAGEPLRMMFDVKRRVFEFEFRHDSAASAPTEIFVPTYQYPGGYAVEVSDGTYEAAREPQTLIYCHETDRDIHTIRIRPAD